MYFLWWVCCKAAQIHSHKEGWDTGIGRHRFIQPNSGILIENPLAGKAGHKKFHKSVFGKFTSMEKYTLRLLTECIWQHKNLTK